MNLTKNFTLEELIKSDTAEKYKISNIPNQTEIENLKAVCEKILQPLRDKFGAIRVTSGYRCRTLNTKLNGSSTSNHLYGYAVDIQPKKADFMEVYNYIVNNFIFDECFFEKSKTAKWLHIAYRRNLTNRKKRNSNYITF